MSDSDRGLPRHFQTTQWSVVLTAAQRSTPEGRAAFSDLCERYWYPLYAHIRRNEPDVHRAHDLTQSFFAKVMEKNYVADADPRRGRFRTFLLTSLQNFVANEWDKMNAKRRGGGRMHLSLKLDEGDRRFSLEAMDASAAESCYERRWAIELLGCVLNRLKLEYANTKRQDVYDQLKQYLLPGPWPAYRDVAERLGMTEGAVKVAVGRLRKRYQILLRNEIRETVSDPSDVEDEVGALFRAFSP